LRIRDFVADRLIRDDAAGGVANTRRYRPVGVGHLAEEKGEEAKEGMLDICCREVGTEFKSMTGVARIDRAGQSKLHIRLPTASADSIRLAEVLGP
jgi:hypothetical protein